MSPRSLLFYLDDENLALFQKAPQELEDLMLCYLNHRDIVICGV